MTAPALLLSFLLASLYGLVFFLFFGGGWLAMAAYWLAALVGFGIGQFVSSTLSFSLFPIGSVNVLEASVTAWIALLVARSLLKK